MASQAPRMHFRAGLASINNSCVMEDWGDGFSYKELTPSICASMS